jgi:DeoR family fructose operon transcriptional repressor
VAATDRALAGAALQVVVLADHTKIGQETMCQTVPAARIHTLITDSKASAAELAAIREAGVDVRVAEVGDQTAHDGATNRAHARATS